MTLDRVREIISENTRVDINEIYADTLFEEDLAIDSLEYFKIVTELEDELDASLDREKISHINTVGELYEFIKNRA
ncbi:MAG: acyl carrier protein [Lachnospiraceae bacterium]|nr:acyl carrier protein [Lachnospiraceae bacterium]